MNGTAKGYTQRDIPSISYNKMIILSLNTNFFGKLICFRNYCFLKSLQHF